MRAIISPRKDEPVRQEATTKTLGTPAFPRLSSSTKNRLFPCAALEQRKNTIEILCHGQRCCCYSYLEYVRVLSMCSATVLAVSSRSSSDRTSSSSSTSSAFSLLLARSCSTVNVFFGCFAGGGGGGGGNGGGLKSDSDITLELDEEYGFVAVMAGAFKKSWGPGKRGV